MRVWPIVGGSVAVLIVGGALAGLAGYRRGSSEAQRAYEAVLDHTRPPQRRFDPAEIRNLPEIAKRYFHHAVAPGTPVYTTVELRMEGIFLLGDKNKFQTYRMTARQALRPPDQFVWMPMLRSGALAITGSDALVGGRAWTRFWMFSLLPVANEKSTPDLVRSAEFRAAVEGALWLPTSLLPENGVEWTQAGPDAAIVTMHRFGPEPVVLRLTLDPRGAVREVVGQRWSNANPEKRFQHQPFGGTIAAEATYQGLTIPTQLSVGNLYGTPGYLPFFQATLTDVHYR